MLNALIVTFRNQAIMSALLMHLHAEMLLLSPPGRPPCLSQSAAALKTRLVCTVDLCHVRQQVEDPARVTPLVVVPRHELHEVIVERDTCLGIEDRRGVVAVQVGGHNIILGVVKNACAAY